jgi:hypothetical protein
MFARHGHSHGAAHESKRRVFGGNPYMFLGPRPFREERLRSYIVREHRAGRTVSEILADPYVSRCGSERFCWKVLEDPRTIAALERNVRDALGSGAD